ncbi:hypothetical protein SHELI_v1c10470 [Spiroplasma helicoides]|nr:hypothetical protein [Spiroplasma helicoides]AOG60353.1 hypothetical protein SHELI_v1c04020 [Spiroplasma helicoides]AOG60994.1 hypothetical protein SHELI_v1c10470 [Spiroplasma helicoides]
MPRKYSEDLKKNALKRYWSGENLDKIALEMNIKAGSQLIRIWDKKSKLTHYDSRIKTCKEVEIMSKKLKKEFVSKDLKTKEKENKVLKEKIRLLEKQLKFEKEEKILAMASKEILEKSIPSCTATIMLNMLKMSKKDKIMIMATKAYKHYACCQIYYFIAKHGMGTNRLISYFKIHKNTFSKFKLKNNLENPIIIFKNGLYFNDLPNFNSPKYTIAKKLIIDYNLKNNSLASGANLISKWIYVNKGVKVSEKMIRKIRVDHPWILNNPSRKKRSVKKSESKKHNIYVREDLVEMNYSRPNIIGMDGTNFKIFLNNGKNRSKINCLISYDWEKRTIVSYSFDKSENSNSALSVFKETNNYAIEKANQKIIQSDRGSAFANELIFNYVNENDFIVHSMSKKGFKHNAPTESLNGWIKQKFYKTFGNKFENKENFYYYFKKFSNIYNNLQQIKYNFNI